MAATAAPIDETVYDDEPESPIEIVDTLPFDAVDETQAAEAPAEDPFVLLVLTLEETLRALGARDDALAILRALFGLTRAADLILEPAVEEALAAGKILARGSRGLARSPAFTEEVVAWQGILRGESEDFSRCGGALDEWTANVLARMLGNTARTEGIRRELRRRGVAAFGMVSAAA